MKRQRNTVRVIAAAVGLLLTACLSGADHKSSAIGQVGSALNGACTPSSPCSIWPTSATPAGSSGTSSVELGVKVQSSQAGYITGVRFYKEDTNNATHTVNLWDGSGTLLATATSTSESTSGWQTVSLAQPVAVSANTTYVASYLMPGGNFPLDRPGFSSAVVNPPLEALADGQDGANGVYAYGSTSSFPSNGYGASNYWVDVLFSTTTPVPTDGGTTDGSTDGSAGCTPSSPCSIWPTSATPAGSSGTSSVELGVKVQSSQAGYITGVRFYKEDTNNATHTVNLWDGSGTLLATATSTSESTSGWQTVSLAQPVAVSANTTYVASYLMPGGNFPLDRPGFSSAVVNPPLEALADGQDGANGVYAYGSTSSFPSNGYGASNYWVDVLFSTTVASDGGADASGPNAIQQYATSYGQAFCSGQGKCCPGYPAAFDQADCAAAWTTLGWEFTLPANPAVYTAGHLNYNATQGALCLAALQNFACTTGGTVTAAQYGAVTTACLGVLTGTIPVGSGGCISSFECANGYCELPSDGGTGTCMPLVDSGGTCSPGNDSPDEMCSQAGSYQPMLWCNQLAGGATGTCAAPLANGATCYDPTVSASYFDDYGCSSLLCGDDALCGDPATYPTPPPGFCENWLTDAGGD
jgi:hypothetical protein